MPGAAGTPVTQDTPVPIPPPCKHPAHRYALFGLTMILKVLISSKAQVSVFLQKKWDILTSGLPSCPPSDSHPPPRPPPAGYAD